MNVGNTVPITRSEDIRELRSGALEVCVFCMYVGVCVCVCVVSAQTHQGVCDADSVKN